jgi:transcriptional regulator with XRE-family HTH domain
MREAAMPRDNRVGITKARRSKAHSETPEGESGVRTATRSDLVSAFGREVRRRRIGLDMSLEALAKACGVSNTYLGEVETSMRRPRGVSLAAALKIAKGLGVDLADLLGFERLTGAGIEAGDAPLPTQPAEISRRASGCTAPAGICRRIISRPPTPTVWPEFGPPQRTTQGRWARAA